MVNGRSLPEMVFDGKNPISVCASHFWAAADTLLVGKSAWGKLIGTRLVLSALRLTKPAACHMALDAFVYCDCFEKENLRSNPPREISVHIAANGELTCEAVDEHTWFAFNAWKLAKACMHQGMILVRQRLGNDAAIALVREELQKEAERFPILLEKVVYSSTHTCDWIPYEHLRNLTQELKLLNPDSARPEVADHLRHFKIQIAELIIAAQLTRKPICF